MLFLSPLCRDKLGGAVEKTEEKYHEVEQKAHEARLRQANGARQWVYFEYLFY